MGKSDSLAAGFLRGEATQISYGKTPIGTIKQKNQQQQKPLSLQPSVPVCSAGSSSGSGRPPLSPSGAAAAAACRGSGGTRSESLWPLRTASAALDLQHTQTVSNALPG